MCLCLYVVHVFLYIVCIPRCRCLFLFMLFTTLFVFVIISVSLGYPDILGHPDNVAPAIYGGLQLGAKFTDSAGLTRWTSSQVPIPNGIQCVLFLPNQIVETAAARAILPTTVSRDDAVFNLSRVALLVNALATGSLHNLRVAMEDRLHQPQRGSLENGSHILPLIAAAIKAGAHCACLSGSGPAVLALTSGAKGEC